ncbi:uncharacterized protein LOC126838294 isoform X2 [Adelges cooleyi]|nr:uncharacterized protein LOC126838294 isoform X2 [Adelges cooleyi]
MINFKVPKASMFCPSKKVLGTWNAAFGLQLTENSVVCERHFRKEDVVYRKVFVPNSGITEVATLVSGAIPFVVETHASVKRPNSTINKDELSKKHKIQLTGQPKPIKCIDITDEEEKETTEVVNTTIIIQQTSTATECINKHKSISLNNAVTNNFESIEQPNISVSLSNSQSSKNVILNCSNVTPVLLPTISKSISQPSQTPQINNPTTQISGPSTLLDKDSISKHDLPYKKCLLNSEIIDSNDSSIFKDISSLHRICKKLELPNILWAGQYIPTQDTTMFLQYDENNTVVKTIRFKNSLVPLIVINKKVYDYKKSIQNKIELESLLEQIDNIEICLGNFGVVSKNCKGYFEDDLNNHTTMMCFNCQKVSKDSNYLKIKAGINEKAREIKQLEERVSLMEERVLRAKQSLLKKRSKQNLKNILLAISPFGFLNAIGPSEL